MCYNYVKNIIRVIVEKTKKKRGLIIKMKKYRKEKFSIRKFSFGAASCLIGAQIAISGLANTAEAAMSTFRDQKGGNVTTLYSNGGDSPFEASGSGVYDKVNVDQEITMDIDWSQYSKTNPYVTVTYKYNGGYGSAASNNYGGGRPDFWFTTPIGALEPETITLYNQNTGANGREMTSWSGEKPWVSYTNSVGSRYQTVEAAKTLGAGDPTKWERYNDTTGENGKTYRGDLDTMFWRRIGDQIGGSPSDQGIYKSFRDNTKTMYSDWQKATDPTATIKAKYKIADPTLKNNRITLDFGAGVKVGHAASLVTHFKVTTVEIPVLYKDNELFEPSVPERTGVVDATNLTTAEKTDLKNKIWEKNKGTISNSIPESSHNKFIDNVKQGDDGTATAESSINIAADGTATITYLDGSTDTIPGTSLVYEKPQIDNNETTPANVGDYKYLKNPHAVDNINNITPSDVESARQKFFQVNRMTTTKNEDGDDVIQSVGDTSKTSQDFVGTTLEYDRTKQGFAVVRGSMPTGITIPKADLFKAKPTKVFSAAEAIEKGKQAIDNLTYLSPKEKDNFKNQLTGKTTQDEINSVVNAAIAKNSENEKAIEAKKREIKDKINGLKYLTKEEKDNFINQVNNQAITDPADGDGTGTKALDNTKTLLDNILTTANAKNLEEAKKQAKVEIEKIKADLTNPTAADYNSRIDSANSTTEVEKIVEEAKKQKALKDKVKAQEEANNLKEEYKKKIDQIPGLSDADKTEYKNQIEAATSKNQLDNIIKDAEAKATRNKAIETITNLPHLNNAQKADLIEQVKDATDKEEIEDVVTKAQGLDAKMDSLQQLVTKANDVKNTDKYTNATSGTKTSFDTALTNADAVANKETGKEADASEVDSLIDKLKEAIKNLTGEEVAKPVSKAALEAEVAKEAEVHKSSAYLKDNKAKQDEYDKTLNEAKTVLKDTAATQVDVDAALEKLQKARTALSGKAEDFTLAVKDGAAKISVEPKVGENLTEKDQAKVKEKVTANREALKATDTVEYGKITEKDGKKVVPVKVTRDGITREIDVPVEGDTAAKTTPTAETAKLSETPVKDGKVTKAEDVQKVKDAVKVPEGTQVKDKKLLDEGKVVEGKDEKLVVKVEVTYGDNSKDVVEVPVEGDTAATTTPTAETAKLSETPVKDGKVTKAEDVQKVKDAVKVPEGTQVKDKKLLDEGKVVEGTDQSGKGGANNTGKLVVKVEITYADGSKDVVEVPVEGNTVTPPTTDTDGDGLTDKEEIEKGTDPLKKDTDGDGLTDKEEIEKGTDPLKKDTDGDGFSDKEEVDKGTNPKDPESKPNGNASQSDLDKAKEKAKSDLAQAAAKEKAEIEADKNLTDQQKADKKAEVDKVKKEQEANIDKATTPEEVAKATEEGKKAIDAVHQITPDQAKADLTDAANTEKGEISGDTTLTDKEKEDLKAKVDEVKKKYEDKINNAKTPEEIAKATEEGKKAIADVYNPQTGKGKSTSIFKPELDLQTALVSGKATVEKGKDLTDEEILKQLALADGVTAKITSKPTTTETGTKEAEVEVTLADGTKVTVKVPVEVVASLDTADKDNDLAKAKEDAKKQVEDAAKKKLEEIKKDKDLTAEQKQKAEEEIKKAKDEAKKAIDEASSAGTAKQIADQAKENIEKYNPKADTEVKKPDVTKLDEEKAKAKAEILEKAQEQIDNIKKDKNLSDEEKQKAIESINKAKDQAIENINKGKNTDEVEKAKTDGINEINKIQPGGTIASKFEPKVPENKVEVKDPTKLSDEEREQIRQNIEGANTFPDGTTVEVKQDGTAVITYKDGSSDTISKDKLVTPAKKETGTIASRTEPVIPGKTQVGNTTKLTPEEQAAVKKAVEEANKFPAGTTVEVRPDGTVVITYPDKSVDTITGDKLVEKSTKQTTPKVQTDAEKNPAQVPVAPTPVENTHNLTPAEQSAVAAKVKAANPAAKVTVSKDGTATLTYGDGSVNTIPGTSLVVAKNPGKQTPTQAAQNPAQVPATTEVGNTHNLTPAEQSAVVAKVQAVNPAAKVTVSKDGTATLTYGDGSVNTIPGTRLVVQKEEVPTQDQPTIAEKTKVIIPANPTKVAEATRLTDEEKEAVRKSIVEANGFGSDVRVEVAGDGTATIIFKDGSAITIPGSQLVVQDPKAQDSNKTDAEKTTVKAPSQKIDVKDVTRLTEEEKEVVRKAIETANNFPAGTTIAVAGDGTATITFPDGSVATILGKDTVQQTAAGAGKSESTSESTSDKKDDKRGIQGALAHTGLDNTGGLGLAGLGLAMLSGLLATAKRRKEK